MKNKLQPTRTSFSRNFQCKKAPRWLSKFFHFGTENRADQLKNHPVYRRKVQVDEILVHENYTAGGSKENDIALLRLGE